MPFRPRSNYLHYAHSNQASPTRRLRYFKGSRRSCSNKDRAAPAFQPPLRPTLPSSLPNHALQRPRLRQLRTILPHTPYAPPRKPSPYSIPLFISKSPILAGTLEGLSAAPRTWNAGGRDAYTLDSEMGTGSRTYGSSLMSARRAKRNQRQKKKKNECNPRPPRLLRKCPLSSALSYARRSKRVTLSVPWPHDGAAHNK